MEDIIEKHEHKKLACIDAAKGLQLKEETRSSTYLKLLRVSGKNGFECTCRLQGKGGNKNYSNVMRKETATEVLPVSAR